MTFASPLRRFSATYKSDDPANSEWRLYEVRELEEERLLRTFIGRVTRTQASRPDVEGAIARWCKLFPQKLTAGGQVIPFDLDEVERITDRRT